MAHGVEDIYGDGGGGGGGGGGDAGGGGGDAGGTAEEGADGAVDNLAESARPRGADFEPVGADGTDPNAVVYKPSFIFYYYFPS